MMHFPVIHIYFFFSLLLLFGSKTGMLYIDKF